jgi:hypothetical protein
MLFLHHPAIPNLALSEIGIKQGISQPGANLPLAASR